MKLLLLLVTMLLLGQPAPLSAQQLGAANQLELIQTLIARMEQLEKRVAELEGSRAQVAVTPTNEQPLVAADTSHAELPPGVPEGPALKIAGFSDFNFGASDQRGTRSGFTEGQFILHLNSNLSSKVSFLGELSLSARTDAGIGSPAATGFNAEVERSIIRFEHNDYFKVSFGRYHTPINYWNTAFHHGQWLQTTVSRPEMVQFGGRFIPVHFIGTLVEGAVAARGLNFNYNTGLGNGRGSVISRGGDAGDNNNSRAWLVNMFIKPDRLYGLQVGGSAYRDKVTTGGQDFREWITSAHIVWSRETPEVIAEFANVNHENLRAPSTKSNSQAYYVQTGYRLPIFDKRWKPYYRFEYIHIPRSDAVFQNEQIPNLAGSVAGLRYDISSFAALKFEYRNQRRAPGQPRINSGFVQTSFTF
ncbi:MAG: hypothetical protein DMG13_20135 [Acidobacteria bacterium]|nr:MAG: hypothetical protein DMG13_20135 [Acidobacteriota bacterium]